MDNAELLDLLRQAYDRLTDNDFSPANHALTTWRKNAQAAIAKATTTETREHTLRVRLTDAERATLSATADRAGQSMSEYARRRIFQEEEPPC